MLLEADSAAIEAVLVGWLAGSPSFVRLAKSGIHGWLMSHTMGDPIPLDLPDRDLAVACKAMKKRDAHEYDEHKRIVHLSNYMGTPERIAEEYPDEFPDQVVVGPRGGTRIIPGSVKAKQLQDTFFATGPGQDVRKWQKQTLEIAHRESVLKTVFGVWHYFYNVFTYDTKSGQWRLGEDAKRAVAFRPQSMASSIQDLILLSIARAAPWLFEGRSSFRLPVHDSLIFDTPKSRVMEAARIIYRCFTQPWSQLGGLTIGAEVSIGPNLGEMVALNEEELCQQSMIAV